MPWTVAVRRVRRILAVVTVVAFGAAAAAPAQAAGTYVWPVPGPLVHPYDAPPDPYAPGHRGVDLYAPLGTRVHPMAAGTVTYAGSVAGFRWVTIQHPDGIRTTYGPLDEVDVDTGQDVVVGTRVGTSLGRAHTPGSALLHVSARRGETYLDPTTLLRRRRVVPTLIGDAEAQVTADPPDGRLTLVPGTPPSPNHLIVLAGLTSSTGHLPFDPAVLGYGTDDATQFSYTGVDADGNPLQYGASDTWQRVHEAALALRDQLRAQWAAHPGQAVDLVGHSLGGLVAVYYLLVLHDPADPTLPPIGRVATIASPLQGADAAAVVNDLQSDPATDALLELIAAHRPELDDDAPVMRDLAPGSAVTDAIAAAWERVQEDRWSSPLANGTEVLTIGALLDPVVPAHRSDLPGVEHHTVVDGHSGAPRDATTIAMLDAFLAGEPLPDRSLGGALTDLVADSVSLRVSLLERLLGFGLKRAL